MNVGYVCILLWRTWMSWAGSRFLWGIHPTSWRQLDVKAFLPTPASSWRIHLSAPHQEFEVSRKPWIWGELCCLDNLELTSMLLLLFWRKDVFMSSWNFVRRFKAQPAVYSHVTALGIPLVVLCNADCMFTKKTAKMLDSQRISHSLVACTFDWRLHWEC